MDWLDRNVWGGLIAYKNKNLSILVLKTDYLTTEYIIYPQTKRVGLG